MHLSVLTDQIEAQTEKITELERNVNSKTDLLGKAEEALQKVGKI